jgi:hypothetical protein
MGLARELGVTYFRPTSSLRMAQWNGTCQQCDLALQSGFQLVLTVAASGRPLQPSSAPKDLEAYKRTLGEILDKYPPALLAIENEENSSLFYTSTPQEYGEELKAGCEVAHSKGIKCTNGGLVSTLVALLVYDHYVSSGDTAKAQDFVGRTLKANQRDLLNTPQAQAQIEKGRQLLEVYKTAGMDYVNFHWYIGDTRALEEAVAFLEGRVGLPVITNEIGQFNDDPNQTKAVLQKTLELGLPIVIWFGFDGPQARGLVDTDGRLRPTGQAFMDFVRQNSR